MQFDLKEQEFKKLRLLQRKERNTRRFKKLTVLIMLHNNYKISEIELALGLDDNTIRKYVSTYREKSLEVYLSDNYVGCVGKLSKEQEDQLAIHLEENLYSDADWIRIYVNETFGVNYSLSGITKLLHRLEFVYKQTKTIPSKADETSQKEFLEKTLSPILKEVDTGDSVVYYSDGCHPTHNTKSGYGWIRKGQEFEVDCNSGRQRININAAINAMKPEHLVWETTATINAQSTQRICRQLLKKHPNKKIYLICDNARYNRNKMLKEWSSEQRIEFIYLPPYSPNLNLIERLWRLMRKEVINNNYYDTYSKFKTGVEEFLENSKCYKTELRSLMTLNFRTVGGTSFYA